MIFTPARARSSTNSCATADGTARTATRMSTCSITPATFALSRTFNVPISVPTLAGSESNTAPARNPWSAKMSEVAIAVPGWPAPNSDVVLPGAPQDRADLCDERLDVVADAALAELAEARQIPPDLGRVDVRVIGQRPRGNRLLAHLARLREHLQGAPQPRGNAERKLLPRFLAAPHVLGKTHPPRTLPRAPPSAGSARRRASSASMEQLDAVARGAGHSQFTRGEFVRFTGT